MDTDGNRESGNGEHHRMIWINLNTGAHLYAWAMAVELRTGLTWEIIHTYIHVRKPRENGGKKDNRALMKLI